MPICVAFLRGMNVGTHRVKNSELCAWFKAMGFEGVSAFLASGNVLFQAGRKSAATMGAQIEQGLRAMMGYSMPTFVRSAGDVTRIAQTQPFSKAALAASTENLQVALLSTRPPASNQRSALAMASPDDHLALRGREMYWLPKETISESELNLKTLGKILGPMTIRTRRTMERLATRFR